MDLIDEQSNWDNLLQPYIDIGYEALMTSTKKARGLDDLKDRITNDISILVGQSGVGKSSLINALLPEQTIETKKLSRHSGQHTTSNSTLYHLPNSQGAIIDSPGVRDFRLGHLSREEIERGFIEFRPYLGQCRFSDCQHNNEPGCALIDALKNNEINARRFNNYKLIVSP